jgi:triacylglycerol lipase
MNQRHFLPAAATRHELRTGLRGFWLLQLGLTVWAWIALLGRDWSGLGAAAALVGLWATLLVGFTIAGYALKWVLGDWPRSSRGTPVQMLRTMFVEAAWLIRFYLIEQPWRSPAVNWVATDQRPLLLLVHGFLCNGAVWNPLAAQLRRQQRSFVPVCLEPSYRNFEAQLRDLDLAVTAWCEHTGRARVTLIGHSMGGLLVRAYAERFPQRCAAVICVAAPHHGTLFGDPIYGREAGPPSPRCQWLAQMNARTAERMAAPALNVWSADDTIVLPASSARLAATPERALPGYGHMGLIAAPAACKLLLAALDQLESPPEHPV